MKKTAVPGGFRTIAVEPAVSRCMADNAKLISEFPAPTGKTASRHGLRRNSFVMSSIVPSGSIR